MRKGYVCFICSGLLFADWLVDPLVSPSGEAVSTLFTQTDVGPLTVTSTLTPSGEWIDNDLNGCLHGLQVP